MTEAWLDRDASAGLDTPAVLVDLDELCQRRHGHAMRERRCGPPAKTHKSLAVARRQLAAGAVGLTTTIGEAEVFALGGVEDLFIAYPVMALGPKVDRLRRLAERCRLAVGADSIEGVEALAATFRGAISPRVLIEIDSGGARSGVDPGAAGTLARTAMERGLEVVGVFTIPARAMPTPRVDRRRPTRRSPASARQPRRSVAKASNRRSSAPGPPRQRSSRPATRSPRSARAATCSGTASRAPWPGIRTMSPMPWPWSWRPRW
jgi:D-serine deaminase-like pyridoxal phosphate-dependent protein